jgi:hypothetical protein
MMDVDPAWSFDDYQAYERVRLDESIAEQARAQADGLDIDPKSEPHGGYRIACVWPDQVISAACDLSARLADLIPGTPAYPYQAIHSSIGNISAPDGRLVDPDRHSEDRALLDRLANTVEEALTADPGRASGGRRVSFGLHYSPHGWRWCLAGLALVTGRYTELSTLPASRLTSTW